MYNIIIEKLNHEFNNYGLTFCVDNSLFNIKINCYKNGLFRFNVI